MHYPNPKPAIYNFEVTSMYNMPEKIDVYLQTEKFHIQLDQHQHLFIDQFQNPIKMIHSFILVVKKLEMTQTNIKTYHM